MEFAIDTFFVAFAACLVFFMQAGFALVEVGFTRSKNAANIIMKNFVDFSVGSLLFLLIGAGLMFGESILGVIGTPALGASIQFDAGVSDLIFLFFQTCFCATTVTIVSGAVAGRMKFSSYLLISLVVSGIIYPISGSWVWNSGGWLNQMGFIDFAGSTVVHALGGILSLVAIFILGARRGKFNENGTSNPIAGHSITLGALGVFILWLGWFGFNPGSNLAITGEGNADAVANIFMTTNISAATATVVTLLITRIKYKKFDVGVTLNGALAGLVGVTAGCAAVNVYGAIGIGAISGLVVIYGMQFVERVLKLDDAVGAVAVHGFCGIIGTVLVGLFALEGGLLYGGGFDLLGVQIIGVVAVVAWAVVAGGIFFKLIDVIFGLRVSAEEEEIGLDISEHGISSYPNFKIIATEGTSN